MKLIRVKVGQIPVKTKVLSRKKNVIKLVK